MEPIARMQNLLDRNGAPAREGAARHCNQMRKLLETFFSGSKAGMLLKTKDRQKMDVIQSRNLNEKPVGYGRKAGMSLKILVVMPVLGEKI